MIERNRLLYTAAAIGMVVLVLVWGVIGAGILLSELNSARWHNEGHAASGDVESVSLALAQQACSPSGGRDQNVCAQFLNAAAAGSAARVARWQTAIGIGGFLAVLLTLWLNGKATSAAVDQAKITRRAYEELERPYLVSTVAQDHPIMVATALISQPHQNVPFDTASSTAFHFSNVGRTPAMLVKRQRHRIARWASSGPPEPLVPEISEFDDLDPHGALVTTDKPSQEFRVTGEFRPADPALRQGPEDYEVWYFIGYAIYRDMTGSQLYVTGFCHWYSVRGGNWFLYQTRKTPDEYNYDRKFRGASP